MSVFSEIKAYKFGLILCFFFISLATTKVSCSQHQVGGEKGWIEPDGSEHETYNEWAQQNRFHIRDSLYFKYTNDSVLLVTNEDYANCAIHNPISKFENGDTVFEFDHSGFYYFISGKPGHCEAGQKIITDVMGAHHSDTPVSAPTPSPEAPTRSREGGDGWNSDSWGPSQTNSADSVSTISCLLNIFIAMVFVSYFFPFSFSKKNCYL